MTDSIMGRRAAAAVVATASLAMVAAATPSADAATPHPAQESRTARATSGTAGLKGVDYATWLRDVQAVVDQATPYVTARTAEAGTRKQAIVLDIDNSSLETDFHWTTFPTPAIKPVLELTRYAHSRGAAVFFVTARPGILDSVTDWNLRQVGYPVSGLYVRHLPDLFQGVSTYKTAKRAEIEAKGYTIIANIGNNSTDLVGGHAERTFKLPDYDGKLS
ncbi:HAD family acid phosphatase [Streptomyces griseocarneus]|uniref:HAD family acid phosphatase n=1 Tax=Streptomyces griseocarneus TaxID=51201 RepID=UPI00167D636D|nr:HAD family acid phosphatase [Streptomyces griseocarneus]MBZ6473424.1 hydrolase [Streptomyces griseocarneus]GHG56961.1 hydrolase [Streptomyces griseocarneus]